MEILMIIGGAMAVGAGVAGDVVLAVLGGFAFANATVYLLVQRFPAQPLAL